VYSIDRSLATAARHRKAFWFESLWQFQQSLGAYGQFLNLTHLPISEFIDSSNDLTRVVASRSYNFKDQQTEKALQQVCTRHDIELELVDQAPLILAEQLPIDLAKLKSFTPFRKKIESSVSPRDPLPAPESLAPFSLQNSSELQTMGSPSLKLFPAGEKAALARLDHYLWRSKKALTYKETRNGMVEFDDSTKFSPYLAVGSLSPRKIYQELKKFESEIEANESTYWIYFELLWRVEPCNNVVSVQYMDRLRDTLFDDFQVSFPHVRANVLDKFSFLCPKFIKKSMKRFFCSVFADPQEPDGSVVDLVNQSQVFVPLLPSNLIDSYSCNPL
jgi:deoxyribodipyrimidine photolyase